MARTKVTKYTNPVKAYLNHKHKSLTKKKKDEDEDEEKKSVLVEAHLELAEKEADERKRKKYLEMAAMYCWVNLRKVKKIYGERPIVDLLIEAMNEESLRKKMKVKMKDAETYQDFVKLQN